MAAIAEPVAVVERKCSGIAHSWGLSCQRKLEEGLVSSPSSSRSSIWLVAVLPELRNEHLASLFLSYRKDRP